jgi:hypothetical protein
MTFTRRTPQPTLPPWPSTCRSTAKPFTAGLFTFYGSSQVYTDYVFTAATLATAALTSPTPGSVLAGSGGEGFTWTAPSGATGYILRLGTTVGGYDIDTSGLITFNGVMFYRLPTNGETVYARLFTFFGSSEYYTDYVFTAATQATAALISP